MIPWKATRPNRRAGPLRIRCHSNRWRLSCRESESIFLVNVSTEIRTATFLHETEISESFQRVEFRCRWSPGSSTTSGVGQRALRDIVYVARQLRRVGDTLQCRLGAGAAAAFQHAPALERGGHPRSDLRIVRIEREDAVGHELVAGTVRPVELGGIALRESADQRAHAIGVAHRKAGWPVRVRTRSSVAGSGVI